MESIEHQQNKKVSEEPAHSPQETNVNCPINYPINSPSAFSARLSKKQAEVYDLYVNLGKSQKDISYSLKISKVRVSQILKQLSKKGVIPTDKSTLLTFRDAYPHQLQKNEAPISCGAHGERYWRLHDLHFVVEPYHFYPRYSEVKKSFGIPHGKWVVTFNSQNIEYQLGKLESFDSQDIDECRRLAQASLQEIIRKTGELYGFEVFKDRKCNIKLVNHQLAEVKNGIAVITQGTKWSVQGTDGKVWLVIDKSTGVPELEAVHPIEATDDAKLLDKYYNDLRYNRPPTNSELAKLLEKSIEQNLVNTTLMNHYGKHWESHVKVLNQISGWIQSQARERREERMRFLSQPSKSALLPSQRSLSDYYS